MTEHFPGSSPPDRGTRRARAFWRATAPLMFAATVLFGLIAAVFGPIVLYQLIVRGVRERHASWVVLGVLRGIPWVLVVYGAIKRAFKPSASAEGPGDGPPRGDDV